MSELRDLIALRQDLLNRITDQRTRYGRIDSELIEKYDEVNELIKRKGER